MLVAITGGTGFIGSSIAQLHIKRGDRVRILSRHGCRSSDCVESIVGDLSNPTHSYREFVDDVDLLYHCAGEVKDEKCMRQLHIDGTRRLVDSALKRVGRWVQLSSVGAYGVCRTGTITEETLEKPSGIYEETKTAADKIVRESGIPYSILRPSNVFGSNMPNQSFFQLIEMVQKGRFFHVGCPGSLANYVHVDDVANALWLIGNDKRAIGNVYIISQSVEIELMIKAFADGLGIVQRVYRLPESLVRLTAGIFQILPEFPLTLSRVNALTGRCVYDSSKLRQDLEFEFNAPLETQFRCLASKK